MENSPVPRQMQLIALPFKAVLIYVLDEQKHRINHASGFLRKEGSTLFLYTCWHVVTGYDRNDLKVRNELPKRAFLEVVLQNVDNDDGLECIGGIQKFTLPLYDTDVCPKEPLWQQCSQHVPHPDLNLVNLYVPFWFDAVRLEVPKELAVSHWQVTDDSGLLPWNGALMPGDKLYVVGYPYGYSVHGADQPMPTVLTRFVAATRIGGRQKELLLESTGAPGMSGGPVFLDSGESLYLLGAYTGLLFPDHEQRSNHYHTALGTCSDMSLHFLGHLPFVRTPNKSAA